MMAAFRSICSSLLPNECDFWEIAVDLWRDHIGVGYDWGGFVTWTVAEDLPDKVKNAVIANIPHLSVFTETVRSSFRQIRRSWYIGLFQLPWLPDDWYLTGRGFKNLTVLFSSTSFQPLDIDRHVRAYQKVGAIKGAINYRAAVQGYWSPAPRPIPTELPVDLIWCSHWPTWDDPKQFNALLLESISSQPATTADEVHSTTAASANVDLVARPLSGLLLV